MKEIIIKQYSFNLLYARELVANIPDEQVTLMPNKGIENTLLSLWTI